MRDKLASWGLLGAFVALRVYLFIKWPRCAEDAYITFRTARNLLWYGAPTFNPGEPSWPASSPLWVGWIWAGLVFKIDVEWWARIGSLAAEVLLILAVGKLLNRRAAIAFGILLGVYQCTGAISLSGIEMFAMVAAFAWALTGNKAAVWLLTFSRPEGVILALVASWGRWRANWPYLVAGLGVWVLMMVGTGRLMPAGISAKVGTYGLHAFAGWRWLSLFTPWGNLEAISMGVLGLGALLLMFWARLKGRALVFALTGLGLLGAYFLSGSVYFFWYMALPMCAAMLAIASIPNRLVYVAAITIALASWTTNYPIRRWTFQYRQLIKVAMQLPQEGTVIMDAIGVTGWQRPKLRFVDVIGLCSPKSEWVRKANKDGWLTYLIQDEHPDVVVVKLREAMRNTPDAGEGKPFDLADGANEPVVGSLIHLEGQGEIGSGLVGYKPTQLDQDVIFRLTEPKPKKDLRVRP